MPLLSGWKEIATYMHRGVRTVQRWEAIGLPVRRPRGGVRTCVIAFTEELDGWAHAAPLNRLDEIAQLKAKIATLEAEIDSLRAALEPRPEPSGANIASMKVA